jgi:transposase-like protein
MSIDALSILSGIATMQDMTQAFQDEGRCRQLLEALVWPNGRICPACGFRKSVALTGRDMGKCARPGLYQCSNGDCRHQFTVTTRTPLHSTKLPLRTWLTALWLILQSDKCISSVRPAEALGISQQAAWRMSHALRLMLTSHDQLGGIVEVDESYFGGKPRRDADSPHPGRGRKGLPNTSKQPAIVIVQRPDDLTNGALPDRPALLW